MQHSSIMADAVADSCRKRQDVFVKDVLNIVDFAIDCL